jgi:hypothetical protein
MTREHLPEHAIRGRWVMHMQRGIGVVLDLGYRDDALTEFDALVSYDYDPRHPVWDNTAELSDPSAIISA